MVERDGRLVPPMAFLPAADIVSDTCVHNATRGTLGSCYVATTGVDIGSAPNAIQRDTLWFFDGTDKWLPTGLKTTFNGTWTDPAQRVTAPALAVAVDPDDPNIVYVGTSVGVVRGVLAITGTPAAPVYQWTWTQMMNGLPEAVVQDLSIFASGGVKVMRAALQARGVWEVDLANVSPPPLSYLRTYRTDTRRKLPTVFNTPIVKGDDEDPPSYDNSPDLVLDVNAAAPTVPPSEGDLAAMPRLGSAGVQTHESLSQRQFRVHVLAHHRVADLSIPKNQLRVALMWKAIPSGGVTTLDGVWTALVSAAGTAAQPASLPDGWQKAAGVLWKNPADDVDPRLPRAVTFDVDLTGQPSDTAIMLVAVVMNTSNQITAAEIGAAQDVEVLVMASPHVAAKAILLE